MTFPEAGLGLVILYVKQNRHYDLPLYHHTQAAIANASLSNRPTVPTLAGVVVGTVTVPVQAPLYYAGV